MKSIIKKVKANGLMFLSALILLGCSISKDFKADGIKNNLLSESLFGDPASRDVNFGATGFSRARQSKMSSVASRKPCSGSLSMEEAIACCYSQKAGPLATGTIGTELSTVAGEKSCEQLATSFCDKEENKTKPMCENKFAGPIDQAQCESVGRVWVPELPLCLYSFETSGNNSGFIDLRARECQERGGTWIARFEYCQEPTPQPTPTVGNSSGGTIDFSGLVGGIVDNIKDTAIVVYQELATATICAFIAELKDRLAGSDNNAATSPMMTPPATQPSGVRQVKSKDEEIRENRPRCESLLETFLTYECERPRKVYPICDAATRQRLCYSHEDELTNEYGSRERTDPAQKGKPASYTERGCGFPPRVLARELCGMLSDLLATFDEACKKGQFDPFLSDVREGVDYNLPDQYVLCAAPQPTQCPVDQNPWFVNVK